MKQELSTALKTLEHKGVIIYPTDTTFGLGCDATQEEACQKIIEIKGRNNHNGFIILIDDEDLLYEYVEFIPQVALDIFKYASKPTTIIFSKGKNLAKSVLNSDGSVAIRIVKNEFCKALIRKFNRPIVSTSVNISGEKHISRIDKIPKSISDKVDYIVPLTQELSNKPSSIIKIENDGGVKIIRE